MASFDKHIIIVGTARSGTSWLSETMASQYRYRMLFEPEHQTRTKKGILLCDRWITSKKDSTEAYQYLRNVFKNRIDCDWIAQNSNRSFKRHLWPFIPVKFIIKFVRANLSAQFMNDEFGIPVIHLIRNPYQVIQSQKRSNFPWLYDLSIFAEQQSLVETILERFDFDIRNYKSLSEVEQLCLRWSIENVLPLETFGGYKKQSKVVRYESLFQDLNNYLELCEYFSVKPVKYIDSVYKQPSSKTHPSSNFITQKASEITTQEKQQINKILDIFESQLYPRE